MFWKQNQRSQFFCSFTFTLLISSMFLCPTALCERKIYELKISELSANSPIDQPVINKEQLLFIINSNFNGFLTLQSILIQGPLIQNINSSNKMLSSEKSKENKNNLQKEENMIPQVAPTEKIVTTPPVPKNQIENRQFQGIVLYHQIPITFTQGQMFRFYGRVEKDMSQEQFPAVRISFSEIGNTESKFGCSEFLEKGQTEFDFSCKIRKTGRFFFALFSGTSGFFSQTLRLVNERSEPLILTDTPVTPAQLKLSLIDNDLFVEWASQSVLTKVIVTQNEKTKEFLLSNSHQKFKIPFYEFEDFKAGESTKVEIMHASSLREGYDDQSSNFSIPVSLAFKALEHKFSRIGPQASNIDPIPWKVSENSQVILKGNFTVEVQNKLFIVHPNLTIQQLPIIPEVFDTIKASTNILKGIQLPEPGVYIIQVNYLSGAAIINTPIYVGEGYPIIPDHEDMKLKPKEENEENTEEQGPSEPSSNASMKVQREFMLILLNQLRNQHSVPSLTLDDELNDLAQMHTEDMVTRSFVGHVNPDGDDAAARAKKNKFFGPIGENIATSTNLTNAHLSLERSPAHLKNSVNSAWTKVGFGIKKNNGLFVVTVLFSSRNIQQRPLSAEEIQKYERKLLESVIALNPFVVSENRSLSQEIKKWQSSPQNRAFNLLTFLQVSGHTYAMSLKSMTVLFSSNFVEKLSNDPFLIQQNPAYTQVGISLGQLNGQLEVLLVFGNSLT